MRPANQQKAPIDAPSAVTICTFTWQRKVTLFGTGSISIQSHSCRNHKLFCNKAWLGASNSSCFPVLNSAMRNGSQTIQQRYLPQQGDSLIGRLSFHADPILPYC